jgi:selT/selW/selH-like putative selenoprotein
LSADVELIAGSNGIFAISVNGKNIFSKARAKRFPEPGEITSLVKAL